MNDSQSLLLEWSKKLRAISQIGKTYSKDPYDLERFDQIAQISQEMMARMADVPELKVKDFYIPDKGYATPKTDLRGGVFRDDKILLVREKSDGKWTIPGGWADVCESPSQGVIREVREESGYEVANPRLAAIIDRNLHPYTPPYPNHLFKLFFVCDLVGGAPQENIEISEIDFFPLDQLPPLSLDRVLPEDIERLYRFHRGEMTEVYVD